MVSYTWEPGDLRHSADTHWQPSGMWAIVTEWTPERSGTLWLQPPLDIPTSEIDFLLYTSADITGEVRWGSADSWLINYGNGIDAEYAIVDVSAAVTYQLAVFVEDETGALVGQDFDYTLLADSLADFDAGGTGLVAWGGASGGSGISEAGVFQPASRGGIRKPFAYGRFSDYQIDRWLENLPDNLWFGIGSSSFISASDPLSVEIIGDDYARPVCDLTGSGDSGLVLADEAVFHAIPPGTAIASLGVFDAATNGHLRAGCRVQGPDGNPLHFPDGGTWVIPAGEFFLGLDLAGA